MISKDTIKFNSTNLRSRDQLFAFGLIRRDKYQLAKTGQEVALYRTTADTVPLELFIIKNDLIK